MKRKLLQALMCAGAVVVCCLGSARANTIYANTNSFNGNMFTMANGQEVGDEITVPAGSSLASFAFEYDAPALLAANVAVDVRFYLNNGVLYNGYNTPSTLLFDSGWYMNTLAGNIPSGPGPGGNSAYTLLYTTSDFSSGAQNGWAPNFTVPTDFTFTITWTNLDGSSQVDMPLANNTPGISSGEYWLNNNGTWELLTNSATPGNLLVDFEGQVPEPSVFALTAIGGVLFLGINKLRRKS